jgi:hypothetical protein
MSGEKNALAKAKTSFFRATQKVAEKLGRAEETVDLTFNQQKDRFELHYKAVKRLNETTIKLLSGFREVSVHQATVIQDLYDVYEPKYKLYGAAEKGQEIAKLLDHTRQKFDEYMRTNYVEVLSKYQGQFAELTERISERNTRRLDMDRYAGHLKRAMEKGDREKEASNKAKLEATKQNYKALNEELIKDMPALYEDRVPFFGPLMANYYHALAEYYKECHKILKEIQPDISHVDRTTQHEHPRVTTDPGLSSASHKSTGSTYEDLMGNEPGTKEGSKEGGGNRMSTQYSAPPTTTNNRMSAQYSAPAQSQPSAQPPARSVPSAPPATVIHAVGAFDFNATDPTELSFKTGDNLIIHKKEGDWWEAELNGKKGLVPSNYLKLVS